MAPCPMNHDDAEKLLDTSLPAHDDDTVFMEALEADIVVHNSFYSLQTHAEERAYQVAWHLSKLQLTFK